MALSPQTIVPVINRTIAKLIDDEYARSALAELKQIFVVKKKELANSIWEAYTYLSNEEIVQNRDNPEWVRRWPDPYKILEQGGFNKAGAAAFEALRQMVQKGQFKTSYNAEVSSSDEITFIQEGLDKRLVAKTKTAGIRALSAEVVKAKGKAISFYDDMKRNEMDASGAEDIAIRNLIHIEHMGKTTTGNATLAARLQAYDAVLPGFSNTFKPLGSPELEEFFGPIAQVFELTPTEGLTKIVPAKNVSGINLRIGSFKWNLYGARKEDLKNKSAQFEALMKAAVTKYLEDPANEKQLEVLAQAENIAKFTANAIMNTLALPMPKSKAYYNRIKAATEKSNEIKTRPRKRNKAEKKSSVKPLTVAQEKKVKENDLRKALRLKSVLQRYLFATIKENMVEPALVYRTGRFARSVEIDDVKINKDKYGTPSVRFRYMEYPYRTFEPGGAMHTPQRDPRVLIEGSIREVIREHARELIDPERIGTSKLNTVRRGREKPYISRIDWRKEGGI